MGLMTIRRVNLKVGGVNCALPNGGLPWDPIKDLTLIMGTLNRICLAIAHSFLGADVSHGAPRSGMPSMAALVSTIDPWGRRHIAETSIQERGVEIIEHLQDMVFVSCDGFNVASNLTPC